MKKLSNFIVKNKSNCSDTSSIMRISFLLLGNIFLPALIASIGFLFKISINGLTYILSQFLLLIVYSILFYKKDNHKKFIIPIIVALVIIVLSVFVTERIYDNSVDGWGYHNPAIMKLSEGWNPIYEHFDDETVLVTWSEHYPKAIWLYSAALYKITNAFFAGLSFNIIISFATLFLIIDILKKKKINIYLAIILGIIITFSTTVIGQLFTMYNDGVFCQCILGLLLLYNAIVCDEYKLNSVLLMILSFYLSILANIKFNGALYAFIIALIYSIILIVQRKIKFDKTGIKYVLVIGLCVGIVASNTYITNFIYHRNIGYPVIGNGKVEIINQYIPGYINSTKGKIATFVKAITSSSFYEYIYSPFYVLSINDYVCASASDCRVMGFGPMYQLLLIIAIVFIIVYIMKYIIRIVKKEITLKGYVKENYHKYIPFLFMIIFFFTAPATWWVRYVSYMFVVPILIIVFFNDDWYKVNIMTILSYSIIVLYLVSLLGVGNNMLKQSLEFTAGINHEINYLKAENNNRILQIAPIEYGLTYNSYRQNMSYKLLENQSIKFEKHNTNECVIEKDLDYLAISIVNCSEGKNDKDN